MSLDRRKFLTVATTAIGSAFLSTNTYAAGGATDSSTTPAPVGRQKAATKPQGEPQRTSFVEDKTTIDKAATKPQGIPQETSSNSSANENWSVAGASFEETPDLGVAVAQYTID